MTEGIDYFVHFAKLATRANPSVVLPNDDGTFDIYINTLFPEDTWEAALRHELRHLKDEHFYIDIPIAAAERQAEGEAVNVVLHPLEGSLPHFASEAAFAHWLQRICAQRGVNL